LAWRYEETPLRVTCKERELPFLRSPRQDISVKESKRDLPFLRSPRQDISVKESKREIFLSSDLHAKTYQ
jgi:hypothetical protein